MGPLETAILLGLLAAWGIVGTLVMRSIRRRAEAAGRPCRTWAVWAAALWPCLCLGPLVGWILVWSVAAWRYRHRPIEGLA